MDPLRIEIAVRTATYEIFTLHEAGIDVKPTSNEDTTLLLNSSKMELTTSDDGKVVSVIYRNANGRKAVIEALMQKPSKEATTRRIPKKIANEETWKSIPFPTPEIKFAVRFPPLLPFHWTLPNPQRGLLASDIFSDTFIDPPSHNPAHRPSNPRPFPPDHHNPILPSLNPPPKINPQKETRARASK